MPDPIDPVYAPPAITNAQPNAARPHRGRKLVWTLVPITVYLIAYRMNIPTFSKDIFDVTVYFFRESHTLMAVGLFPWFFASAVIQLSANRSSRARSSTSSRTDLYHVTNFIGLVFAIFQCAWVVLSWYDFTMFKAVFLHITPTILSTTGIQSPILAYISLLGCTIVLKLLVDFALPRSMFAKNDSLLAIVFLTPLLHSFVTNMFIFDLMAPKDYLRLVGHCFQCVILVAFILLNPPFMSRDAPSKSATAKGLAP